MEMETRNKVKKNEMKKSKMKLLMQQEIEYRQSNDYKLNEMSKRIESIKETIVYKVKMEEIKA